MFGCVVQKQGDFKIAIANLRLTGFTVFETLNLEFSKAVNVIIGENGVGKTHILKLLYAACCASNPGVSFSQKTVMCFRPDDYSISRLISRKQGVNTARVEVTSFKSENQASSTLSMSFHKKTKKWEADVTGEEEWERQIESLNSIFIPANEILSNAYNLNAAVDRNNVIFDDTYLDLLNSARIDISVGSDSAQKSRRLKHIEAITGGKVSYDRKRDEFYLRDGNSALEFSLVAEGIRKICLLWQLVKNGYLEKGCALFWDEPEANMNPANIPFIADLLLALAREGLQIFISTHDYFLAKYLEMRSNDNEIRYCSLYRAERNLVNCEASGRFAELERNAIMNVFMDLYHEEVGRAME